MELEFEDFKKELTSNFTDKGWTILYKNLKESRRGNHSTIYSALVKNSKKEHEISDYSWGLRLGSGKPGLIFFYENDEEHWRYDRFSEENAEPLIIYRDFPGVTNSFLELSEEFRLYFNLFEERKGEEIIYYWIDDNGEYQEVAKLAKSLALVKTKFIKHFLSIKDSTLFIYFDCMRFSESSPEDLNIAEKNETYSDDEAIYNHLVRNIGSMGIRNDQTQSWLLGKISINGIKDFKPDFFNSFEEKGFEEFLMNRHQFARHLRVIKNDHKRGVYEQQQTLSR